MLNNQITALACCYECSLSLSTWESKQELVFRTKTWNSGNSRPIATYLTQFHNINSTVIVVVVCACNISSYSEVLIHSNMSQSETRGGINGICACRVTVTMGHFHRTESLLMLLVPPVLWQYYNKQSLALYLFPYPSVDYYLHTSPRLCIKNPSGCPNIIFPDSSSLSVCLGCVAVAWLFSHSDVMMQCNAII